MSKHEDAVPNIRNEGFIRCTVDWYRSGGQWYCHVSMGDEPQVICYHEPTAAWKHLTDGITAALAEVQRRCDETKPEG